MYAGWLKDATTDPELIGRYFNDVERNIGLTCGDPFEAWDIEADHVGAFMAFVEQHGTLPESPIQSTGRGGIHILARPVVGHTRKLYLDGVHIGELKSTGGFIVVAPSETEQQYRWLHLPDRLAVQSPPDWLQSLLERPKTIKWLRAPLATPDDVVAALGRLAATVAHAPEGTRNNYLYWAVRRAIEESIPAKHVARVMQVAGREAGLDAHEVDQTIESALVAEDVAA